MAAAHGLSFEKKISRNAEQRAKFEDDPSKFIASEAELDAEIKALSILSEHPELYPEFARLGCVGSLVGLLAHENTDIAIDAVEIIDELTDEDVAAEEAQYDALVEALLEADLLSLLVSNLERLDETQEMGSWWYIPCFRHRRKSLWADHYSRACRQGGEFTTVVIATEYRGKKREEV